MGFVLRAVAKSATIFSRQAYPSASVLPSLFINNGVNRYHQHTQPSAFSIVPAFMLLSFGMTHLSYSECTPKESTECTPKESTDHGLCLRAAHMLYCSRMSSFTVADAMKVAGYCKEDCQSGMHRKRVQRAQTKLAESDG